MGAVVCLVGGAVSSARAQTARAAIPPAAGATGSPAGKAARAAQPADLAVARLAKAGPVSGRAADRRADPRLVLVGGTAPHRLVGPAPSLAAAAAGSDRRTGRALMIVGAAGILTGLIVDESIVTIAGAGVGGYGLYLYIR